MLQALFAGRALDLETPADPVQVIWDYLRRRPLEETYELVSELAARVGLPLDGLPRPVALPDLRGLGKWPFEIGSHSISHRPLPSLSTEESKLEIRSSRSYLEAHTRHQVRAFSYPFGLLDRDVSGSCRAAGYLCAVSVAPGNGHRLLYSDTFDLPRVDAGDLDIDDLVLKLYEYERENLRSFAIHGPIAPTPLDVSPQRRSIYSLAKSELCSSTRDQPVNVFSCLPVNRFWGCGKGTPLDRVFINQFMQTHAGDLHGRILEIKSTKYAGKFSRRGSMIDVLDIDPSNTTANIIDDLQSCVKIEDETYDCVVLTQVLQLIPDFEQAVASAARILRPGGVLLLTTSGITQAVPTGNGEFFWSFFKPGLKRVLAKYFDAKRLLIQSHGNAGIAASFLMGIVAENVPLDLFSHHDPEYPIVLTVRAVKPLPTPAQLDWAPKVAHPDVSVIVPMFNAEKTIKEALFSVARQSHDSYEILVVDDGSTDGSRKIVEEIARASRGRVLVLENSGKASGGSALPRNLAIRYARGEFLVFLDSDDAIHPEKIAHDVEILRSHPDVAAVVGRALWWWDGSGERDALLDMILEPADRVIHPPDFFNATYHIGAGADPPCPCSWMVRKEVMDKIGPFDQNLFCDDLKFLAELSLRFPVYVASACLCEYRRKEGTIWANLVRSGADKIDYSRFLDWKASVLNTSPAFRLARSHRAEHGTSGADHISSEPAQPTQQRAAFNFGDLGLQPVCRRWGFSRGAPIDRRYIEEFLSRHAHDIRGRVLEIKDNSYTLRFGGDKVTKSDALDILPQSDSATIIADLMDAPGVPSDTFDCVILTHVLVLIQDVPKALATVCRILRPGGVALITVPGISQISSFPEEAKEWSWSFYTKSLRWLLLQHPFDEESLLVEGRGNLKTTIGFLVGLAQSDIEESDYAFDDESYPLVVTARAVKQVAHARVAAVSRSWESGHAAGKQPAPDLKLSKARMLLNASENGAAFAILNTLKAQSVRVPDIDYLRALCFLTFQDSWSAVEALKEELRYFPENQQAEKLLANLQAYNRPKLEGEDDEFLQILEFIRPYTMVGEDGLLSLFRLAKRVCEEDLPGNFVECGVAAGGSSALLAAVIARHSKRPRKLFAFDTFEGMPEPSPVDSHAGKSAEETGWGTGTCSAPLDSLGDVSLKLGVENLVEPIKGLFADTLPANRSRIGQIALIHLDADWYRSTLEILNNLFDAVSPGAPLQVDDYGVWDGCTRALVEFQHERRLNFQLNQIHGVGVWFVKETP
jgi:glycosyltransferase involved in cell wall biosynthesis/ubiquinone/menaquinone biosynthesis C-methylase UbiE